MYFIFGKHILAKKKMFQLSNNSNFQYFDCHLNMPFSGCQSYLFYGHSLTMYQRKITFLYNCKNFAVVLWFGAVVVGVDVGIRGQVGFRTKTFVPVSTIF